MKNSNDIEQAPVLRLFGQHGSRIATLLRIRPNLMSRVLYAPRPAIHAYGAFLYSPEADRPDAEVAATLDLTDPRALLRAAIPNAPPKLYRALDRAGDRVMAKSFYQRLERLCAGPLSEMLLADGVLDERRLDYLEALLAMDPLIVTLKPLLARRKHEIEAADIVIRFLRAHNAIQDDQLRLPEGAGLSALLRRLQDLLDRIPAPKMEFTLPPPFKFVETIGEMRQVGSALGNCTGHYKLGGSDHWFSLADKSKVYVTAAQPPLLAALQPVGNDLYYLDDVCGPKNARVDIAARNLLTDALRVAGMRLVQDTPSHAFAVLVGATEPDETEETPAEIEAEIEDALAA